MACPNRERTEWLARGGADLPMREQAQAHLGECPECRSRFALIQGVKSTLELATPADPGTEGWTAIDRHVVEAMASARSPRSEDQAWAPHAWAPWRFVLAGALAAGVVATGAWVEVGRRSTPAAPVASESMALAIAIGGDARIQHPPRISEGEVLTTGSGTLVVQTAPSTGVLIGAGGEAVMSRLRTGDTEITLNAGELLAEVKPLQPGERFEVRAGAYVVHVVGTAFEVRRTVRGVQVAVVHGRVRVTRDGDADEVFVSGGTQVELAAGASMTDAPAPTPIDTDLAGRFPLNLPELTPEEVLSRYSTASITTVPSGAAARVDGVERGVTPLTVIATPGSHEITATLPDHVPVKARLQVSSAPASANLRLAAAVALEDLPAPTPAPEPRPVRSARPVRQAEPKAPPAPKISFQDSLHQAAMGHRPELVQCASHATAWIPGQLKLAVELQPDGHVAPPVKAEEPGVDDEFLDCVNSLARSWAFPPPGQSVTVTVTYDIARP